MTLDMTGYVAPAELDAAIALLARDPNSVAIAGGNGLLTRLKRGEASASMLVDLRHLAELRGVAKLAEGRLRIGALTTLSELVTDPEIRAAHVPGVLADAVATIGDVQARNRATIGGTLASAERGSDLSAALLVLEASVSIAGMSGHRSLSVADYLSADSPLDHDELIISVDIAAAEPGSAYQKLTDRASLQALCGVAATVALSDAGVIERCRIAVTGAFAVPQRVEELEAAALGASVPLTLAPLPAGRFVSTHQASAPYLAAATKALTERAVSVAVTRAQHT